MADNEEDYIARVLKMSSEEIAAEAEAVGVEVPPERSLDDSLRNLRFRLEAALANRLEEGDREAISWLNEGVIAISAALTERALPREGCEQAWYGWFDRQPSGEVQLRTIFEAGWDAACARDRSA